MVLQAADEWPKPLNVICELPAICNAPGVRLLFQLAGFVDYRVVSVAQLLARGHDVLFFDEAFAAMQASKQNVELQIVSLEKMY
jgi:ABC-type taurine transport system ATPase subunit